MRFLKNNNLLAWLAIGVLIVLSNIHIFRIDLTSDARHTISAPSQRLMKRVERPVKAVIYLTGDLNAGFLRLKHATTDMLAMLNAYAAAPVKVTYSDPSNAPDEQARNKNFQQLQQRGITPTAVYEKDKTGKSMRKEVFPWVELTLGGKTIPVNLLKNNPTRSGEENLNASIENLEFELTDALSRLLKQEVDKIAFLEGHGELSEWETFDAARSLSRYFQIDRGTIGTDARALDTYKAIVVAAPQKPFPEKDKFVLDQYLMRGGTILWLLDGVNVSDESLAERGTTPAIPLELNLNDLLFRYGIRLLPVVLEDAQSLLMPVNIAAPGDKAEFTPMSWVYDPLLLTAPDHAATKNLSPVKAHFASALEPVGSPADNLTKQVVLASSSRAHLTQTPANITIADIPDTKDNTRFNLSFVPVGVVLQGVFHSAFANRMPPPELTNTTPVSKRSNNTRQAIIADGDIIRNDIRHTPDTIEALPLGFDRYSGRLFGNRELITNLVLYLTDKEGHMLIRTRSLPLRLLNKSKTAAERTRWQLINLLIPLTLLLMAGTLYAWRRKQQYGSESKRQKNA